MSVVEISPSAIESFEQVNKGTLDFAKIPAFLRVLLTTDGTVTKSLEAFFWEPLAVEPSEQKEIVLSEPAPHIERDIGDSVLQRKVRLRGINSNTTYLTAESLICMDMLSSEFQQALKMQRLGIGELLRECGLETYREILEVGEQSCPNTGLSSDVCKEVWRTYRIVMEHHPFIQITERFPLAVYQ